MQTAINSAAAGELLDVHGPLMVIDNLVLQYPAYKHDDIFNMNVHIVYELLTITKKRSYINSTALKMRRKSKK